MAARSKWLARTLWFIALWAAGVATVAVIGFVIRTWLL